MLRLTFHFKFKERIHGILLPFTENTNAVSQGSVEVIFSWNIKHVHYCDKFIQNTTIHILLESVGFYRRYDKNILAYFLLGHSIEILTKRDH